MPEKASRISASDGFASLSRRATAASSHGAGGVSRLDGARLDEGGLDRMELATGDVQALDRPDVVTIGLGGEQDVGRDQPAVQQDAGCARLAGLGAEADARETLAAQHREKGLSRLARDVPAGAVQAEVDRDHRTASFALVAEQLGHGLAVLARASKIARRLEGLRVLDQHGAPVPPRRTPAGASPCGSRRATAATIARSARRAGDTCRPAWRRQLRSRQL